MFSIYCRYKVKKDKNLKTLRQNNAVLRRAALSERKQRRTELVRSLVQLERTDCKRQPIVVY